MFAFVIRVLVPSPCQEGTFQVPEKLMKSNPTNLPCALPGGIDFDRLSLMGKASAASKITCS